MKALYCGIDLAAKEKNPTGFCLIDENLDILCEGILHSDEEIIELLYKYKPKVLGIDAPLSLPRKGYLRKEEKILIREGYRILPFFKSMKDLAMRAKRIERKIKCINIIEVYPNISAKILGIKREKGRKRHIIDARIAAITAKLYSEGKCRLISGRFYVPLNRKY
ncbi:MAG: DUF429 domain-containing protein [Candidatus Micrarchaeota archaeon]|nr:DUF429 domain-containing protein [Candidatus Micrarchaeota archaeon]